MNWMDIIALLISLIFLILIYILVGEFRTDYLHRMMKKNKPQKFFEAIEAYMDMAKTDKKRNRVRLWNLLGMIKFHRWDGIDVVINTIVKPNSASPDNYIWIFSFAIINLYILDRIDEANLMIEKIDCNDKKLINHNGIMSCLAIYNYFNNKPDDSRRALEQLIKVKSLKSYFKANIFYYLGLIALDENDLLNSKMYFSSVRLYHRNGTLVEKSDNMLANI